MQVTAAGLVAGSGVWISVLSSNSGAAYVSFFGFGGIRIGGWGGIGWLPLGPGDFFHPWWGRWGGYASARLGENRGGFAPLRAEIEVLEREPGDGTMRTSAGATSVSGHDFGTGHGTVRAVSHSGDAECAISPTAAGSEPTARELLGQRTRGGVVTTANASQNHTLLGPWRDGTASNGRSLNSGSANTRSSNERSSAKDRPMKSANERSIGSSHETARSGNSAGSRGER